MDTARHNGGGGTARYNGGGVQPDTAGVGWVLSETPGTDGIHSIATYTMEPATLIIDDVICNYQKIFIVGCLCIKNPLLNSLPAYLPLIPLKHAH